jgi:hypothetical protein
VTREAPERRVSTGVATLDAALGELYWGDNVVWQLDGVASADSFYRAIASLDGAFDLMAWVAVSRQRCLQSRLSRGMCRRPPPPASARRACGTGA